MTEEKKVAVGKVRDRNRGREADGGREDINEQRYIERERVRQQDKHGERERERERYSIIFLFLNIEEFLKYIMNFYTLVHPSIKYATKNLL